MDSLHFQVRTNVWEEMQKRYPRYIVKLTRQLRERATPYEKALWQRLRNRQLGELKFYRQFPIGRYIADFYCDSLRLVIELEGGIHNKPDQKEYDEVHFEELKSMGLVIMRLRNEEVEQNIERVLERILALVDPHP